MNSEQLAGQAGINIQHPAWRRQLHQAPPRLRHKALIGSGGFSPADSTLNPEVELMHSESQLEVGVSERRNHFMEQWKNLIHDLP